MGLHTYEQIICCGIEFGERVIKLERRAALLTRHLGMCCGYPILYGKS